MNVYVVLARGSIYIYIYISIFNILNSNPLISCYRNKQGHFSASDENTVTDTSDSDESSTRRSCRKRKAISYKGNFFIIVRI